MNTISLEDVIRYYGRHFADRVIAYCRHHTDDEGRPFWTEEEFEDICGLIEREDAPEAKRDQ